MSEIFVNDLEDDAFNMPEEQYFDEPIIATNEIDWKIWTMALIIGYLILKNIEHVMDLSQWSKSDLLLMVAVGIWAYRYYVLNIGE